VYELNQVSKPITLSQEVSKTLDQHKLRYYRKNTDFFKLLNKIKLWPARSGTLHGIKVMKITGDIAEITTHCNKTFVISNSRNSRAARWLRNKLSFRSCEQCKIPTWKLEKYSATVMKSNWGSTLQNI